MEKERVRPVLFRLPERLRRELGTAARANRRSLNSEVIARLDQSLESEANLSPDAIAERLKNVEGLMREFKQLFYKAKKERDLRDWATKKSEGDKS